MLEKIPLLALSVASSAVTFLVQKRSGFQADDLPVLWRINNALVAFVTYLWQMIWPAKLAAFYPHPLDRLPARQVIGAAFILFGITALVFLWRRQRPGTALNAFLRTSNGTPNVPAGNRTRI